MATTFPLFPRLPPELRNQIWNEALPHSMRPILSFYRGCCWQRVCPPETTPIDFDYRLLPRHRISVPMASANVDACGIAMHWAQRMYMRITYRPAQANPPVFYRLFDPRFDAIYIGPEQWSSLLYMESDRVFWPDVIDTSDDVRPGLQRIALSEALVRAAKWTLPLLLGLFYDFQTMYIIMNAPPDFDQSFTDDDGFDWELDSSQQMALWTGRDWKFHYGGEDDKSDNEIRSVLELASGRLSQVLLRMKAETFQIQPAVLVRK